MSSPPPDPSAARTSIGWAHAPFLTAAALPWVWEAHVRASWATLGRDQGIFQYVAWAVATGHTAYRDVRDVNGPLTILVHRVMLALGGADEHRFRVLDLLFTALAALFVGAALPSLGAERPSRSVRAAWALATWVIVSSQVLGFGWWDTAQRESFFDWFVMVSFGCALFAAHAEGRRRVAFLVLAGAASAAPWLGKPTYALVTVVQVVALAFDEEVATRAHRLRVFASGVVAGLAVPFGWLLVCGDAGAWARITFHDVPVMYKFIWPRGAIDILSAPWTMSIVVLACAASLATLGLVFARGLPRRALPIAALPLVGLVSVIVQKKGFLYHFHPVSLGAALALLALGFCACTFAESARRHVLLLPFRLLLVGGFFVLAARAAITSNVSAFPPAPPKGIDLEGPARLAPFVRVDFFPYALRTVAAHLRAHTSATDTVQTYGMDPYLLFLAQRKSATPYIYGYDLDADAALMGSWRAEGLHPTLEEQAQIRALRDGHERDMLARIEKAPPAAFVFIGRSPLLASADALVDFQIHCPDAAAWVLPRYRETLEVDGIRVLMRADLVHDAGPADSK